MSGEFASREAAADAFGSASSGRGEGQETPRPENGRSRAIPRMFYDEEISSLEAFVSMSPSPFGTGISGALAALKKPTPSVAKLPNGDLDQYLRIVLDALHSKIADRSMGSPMSKVRSSTDIAHFTLVEQGLRLLVLERIMQARNVNMPARMVDWLVTLKMSTHVADALRGAGLPQT